MNEHEKRALLGDRDAIVHVVSALRKYRAAASKLLASRYNNGEVGDWALYIFQEEIIGADDNA